MPISMDFKVVGVTFVEDYPTNLQLLSLILQDRYDRYPDRVEPDPASNAGPAPVQVELIRNPNNVHDENAIEVHVEWVGMLGHVPRARAAELAPCLDTQEPWNAYVDHILVHNRDETISQPGVQIHAYEVIRPTGPRLPRPPSQSEFEHAVRMLEHHKTHGDISLKVLRSPIKRAEGST